MNELGKKIDKISNQLTDLRWEIWTKHSLFTWQWWMLLGLCIVVSILFIILIKKEKLVQTIAYFGIIFILNKYIDEIATALDWYDYRIQVQPGIIPSMLVANLFIIPMALSIIYQRYSKWKPFLIALGLFSIFTSYIALFFLKIVGIYLEKAWNAHWSCISLVVMGVIAKIVIDRVVLIQAHNNGDQSNSDPSSPIT
ncbi:CBO0543 family protein [Ectobacillus funiculus]|uniref:CBO0543 family protein n=1 Tax=Ectobacillus funiculus TaxID=137993 RepID=A0ABV5WJB7_9BACI